MCYSEDLRTKALECLNKGMGMDEATHFLGIGKRTLYRWLKQKRDTGHLKRAKPIHTVFKIDPEILQLIIAQHCDMYQKDIAHKMQVSQSGICRAFKRLKITRKKRPKLTKSGTK
jgi:transposase